jgi:hypothetical protein
MQAEYEERFRAMQAEMERRQRELMEAQDTIRSVERAHLSSGYHQASKESSWKRWTPSG